MRNSRVPVIWNSTSIAEFRKNAYFLRSISIDRVDRLIHHPVFEEAYTISGNMDYNFGRMDPGTYFFRPAKVKHGHFTAGEEKGTTWIFRLDGSLINWVTIEEKIIVEGKALNYDPKTEGPVMAGLPVRSKSTGPWNLDGQ